MKLSWKNKHYLKILQKRLGDRKKYKGLSEIVTLLLREVSEAQKEAFEKLQELAGGSDPTSIDSGLIIDLLGSCYLFGFGTEPDSKKALDHLMQAARVRIPSAIFHIAWMLQNNLAVAEDIGKIQKLYSFAANTLNYPLALIELANMIVSDKTSSEADYKEALELYHRARAYEIPEVDLGIGWLHQYCLGGIKNIKIAAKYYQSAAEAGLARAQFNMGVLHSLGLGVKRDQKKSVKFYTLAAEQDLAQAQLNLAVHFYTGDGVNKDLKQAFKLTKKAAKQGLMDAQFRLALMYNTGIGVERKPKKALVWFQNAAENGHERAKTILQEIKQSNEMQHSTELIDTVAKIKKHTKINQENREIPKEEEVLSIISMAPVNSSGDIYHILSYIIFCSADKMRIPDIVLCYDTESGSRLDTRDQVERALNFAHALGYANFFKNPFLKKALLACLVSTIGVDIVIEYLGAFESQVLHLENNTAIRQNARQSKLEEFLHREASTKTIHYTDQRALTTILSSAFRRDRIKVTTTLELGYRKRNPLVLTENAQQAIRQYAQYWIKKIHGSLKTNQPLVVLHIRYSENANKKQAINDHFLQKLTEYIKKVGYQVWFIFADDRSKGSFTGISKHRISPFNKPLKKRSRKLSKSSQIRCHS